MRARGFETEADFLDRGGARGGAQGGRLAPHLALHVAEPLRRSGRGTARRFPARTGWRVLLSTTSSATTRARWAGSSRSSASRPTVGAGQDVPRVNISGRPRFAAAHTAARLGGRQRAGAHVRQGAHVVPLPGAHPTHPAAPGRLADGRARPARAAVRRRPGAAACDCSRRRRTGLADRTGYDVRVLQLHNHHASPGRRDGGARARGHDPCGGRTRRRAVHAAGSGDARPARLAGRCQGGLERARPPAT